MRNRHSSPVGYWNIGCPASHDQALAGDLLEEFRSGRTALWFWRQVLSAVFLRCWRELLIHRSAMLFAVLWSMLTPAWLVAVADLEARSKLSERLSGWTGPGPIVDRGLLLATNLIFIWAGILVYLLTRFVGRGKPPPSPAHPRRLLQSIGRQFFKSSIFCKGRISLFNKRETLII